MHQDSTTLLNAEKTPARVWYAVPALSAEQMYRYFQLAFATVLLVAAGLKIAHLNGGQSSVPLFLATTALALLECGLALLLVVDVWRQTTWYILLVTLCGFSGATLTKGVLGADLCGCLGAVKTSPWTMLMVDLGFVAAFVVTSQHLAHYLFVSIRQLALLGALAAMTGSVAAWVWPVDQVAPGVSRTWDGLRLDPTSWIGQQFPVAARLDQGAKLMQGTWRVLIYSTKCPHCAEVVKHGPSRWAAENPTRHVALVNVDGGQPQPSSREVEHLATLGSEPWLLRVPAVVDLRDGVVEAIIEPEILGTRNPSEATQR